MIGLVERARRARFAATPAYAWRTQVRRAAGRTRLGALLKRMQHGAAGGTPPEVPPPPPSGRMRPAGRNVLLVSHCDFTGNSAYHVYAIATELARRGWSPAIAVPGSPRGVRDLGHASFPVLSFGAVRHGRLRFPDGTGADLVHAFTPRDAVRRLTLEAVERWGCPYLVHLEDNEASIGESVLGSRSLAAASGFVGGAAGVTAVIDRLLELKPEHVPGIVVWPGYDETLDRLTRPRERIRRDVRLEPDDLAVVYTGNVHETNLADVAALYEAVRRLRAEGRRVVLVKSGWSSVAPSRLPKLGPGLHDLGWIRRRSVLELLRAADVLVQPGAPGPFNDYRFPSKLPEFLASGNPVVLPRTNIGLELEDGMQALLLERADVDHVRAAIERLADDPETALSIGAASRRFALERLRWSDSVTAVERLYSGLRTAGR